VLNPQQIDGHALTEAQNSSHMIIQPINGTIILIECKDALICRCEHRP